MGGVLPDQPPMPAARRKHIVHQQKMRPRLRHRVHTDAGNRVSGAIAQAPALTDGSDPLSIRFFNTDLSFSGA